MKSFQELVVVIMCFLVPQVAVSKQDEKLHIYLAFGQSNMEGAGKVSAQDKIGNSRIKLIQNFTCPNLHREYGQWYTAEPPLFGCWGKLSVADYFAKAMLEKSPIDVSIGIVPTAVGGSDIALFQKSSPIGRGTAGPHKIPEKFEGGYAWLLDLAKKAQERGVIKGIILHQGETNTNDSQWKFKVQEIVDDLRKDLKLGNVPFLSGELLYKSQNGCCGSHNSEINKLPNLMINTHIVSAKGLKGVDNAHFSASAYRDFGRRYAKVMSPLVAENTEK